MENALVISDLKEMIVHKQKKYIIAPMIVVIMEDVSMINVIVMKDMKEMIVHNKLKHLPAPMIVVETEVAYQEYVYVLADLKEMIVLKNNLVPIIVVETVIAQNT